MTAVEGIEQAYGEHLKRLRAVVRWCERAADLVAWRMRCASEGRDLDWFAEVKKTRAVLRRLDSLGLQASDLAVKVAEVTELPGSSIKSLGYILAVNLLELRFAELVPPDAPGVKGAKAAAIRVAVGRSLLPAIAALVEDDAVTQLMGRWSAKAVGKNAGPALVERAASATDTDQLRGVALADDGDDRDDPQTGLIIAREAVEKAKADLAKARAAVRRNAARLKARKKAARKKARAQSAEKGQRS